MQPGRVGLSLRDLEAERGNRHIAVSEIHAPPRASIGDGDSPFPPGTDSATAHFYSADAGTRLMHFRVAPAGGGLPHNNMQPYLT